MRSAPDDAPPAHATRRDPVLAVLLGWLVPGLGHLYVGRPGKGLLYVALVGVPFLVGLVLAGFLCVNPEREPVWFVGQAFAGAPAGVVAWLTRTWEPTRRIPTAELGLLYTTVAGLVNLVAISDVIGLVDARLRAFDAWKREREAARAAAAAAAAAALVSAAPPAADGDGPAFLVPAPPEVAGEGAGPGAFPDGVGVEGAGSPAVEAAPPPAPEVADAAPPRNDSAPGEADSDGGATAGDGATPTPGALP